MIKSTTKEFGIILGSTLILLLIAGGYSILLSYVCTIIPMPSFQIYATVFTSAVFIILFWMAFFKKKPYNSPTFHDWWDDRKKYHNDGEWLKARLSWIIEYASKEIELFDISKDKENLKKDITESKELVIPDNETGRGIKKIVSTVAKKIEDAERKQREINDNKNV